MLCPREAPLTEGRRGCNYIHISHAKVCTLRESEKVVAYFTDLWTEIY